LAKAPDGGRSKPKCSVRATVIIYVPLGVSFPGIVLLLRKNKTRIHSMNEDLRRIVVSVPLSKARRILKLVEERVGPGRVSVEITVTCRSVEETRLEPGESVKLIRSGSRFVAYGVCNGRIYQAEIKPPGLIIIKVGRQTSLSKIRGIPSEGDFVLSSLPNDETIREITECVIGGVSSAS
jgi:hypothetical protein